MALAVEPSEGRCGPVLGALLIEDSSPGMACLDASPARHTYMLSLGRQLGQVRKVGFSLMVSPLFLVYKGISLGKCGKVRWNIEIATTTALVYGVYMGEMPKGP